MILIFKNLLNFIKNNSKVFIILILTQIITLLGYFSAFNFYLESLNENKSYYEDSRTFSVEITDTTNLESRLDKVINSEYDIQRMYTFTLSSELDIAQNKKTQNIYGDFENDETNIKMFCGDYYGETVRYSKISIGSYFDINDSSNSDNNIVISSEGYFVYDIGEKYIINGESYNIIGISSDTNYYIPYKTLVNNNLPITGINIILKNEISNDKADTFASYLASIFDTEKVYVPKIEYGNAVNYYNFLMVFLGLVFALSILNFVYIYRYILDKRKKQYAIFRIYGCTKLRGIFMYTAEALIISTVSYIFTSLLYVFVFIRIISMIDKFTVLALNFESLCIVYIVYIIVLFCVVIPTIIKASTKDIVSKYRN